MPSSHRIAQVNELIRREVGNALSRVVELPNDCLVTIEEVNTSRDLSHTTIALSVYPLSRGKEVLRLVQEHQTFIREIARKRIPVKIVPKFHYILDEREERVDKIGRLLDEPPEAG